MWSKPVLLTLLIFAIGVVSIQFVGNGTFLGPPAPATSEMRVDGVVVRNVTVRDIDGRVAWQGDVDLAPVLARIAAGERDPHRNDGSVFHNREGLLPNRSSGHYREYVIRTPGINHAGPQRLVTGRDNEAFYTHDHYRSFLRVR